MQALRRLGTPSAATLIIGDNPAATNTTGAARLSMPLVLVATHAQADVASLAELFDPEPVAAVPVAVNIA
ncbi:HAD hydrolase-like protein [Paraburkholderia elongata]|uniref:Uncharacterized protein n=1 Tax=Paraburkholderia elongata TaxID=2675747 RepID=A0A972SQC1_9BURK|nr:HAD hydrolase-like protein [Paraburkholderia elongata]NPT61960.1 hypothetical protein [Paraburkholderia elongata]